MCLETDNQWNTDSTNIFVQTTLSLSLHQDITDIPTVAHEVAFAPWKTLSVMIVLGGCKKIQRQ